MSEVVRQVVEVASGEGGDAAVRALLGRPDLHPVHERRLAGWLRALRRARSGAARAILAAEAIRIGRAAPPAPPAPPSLAELPLSPEEAEGLAHAALAPDSVASAAILALGDDVGAARAALFRPPSVLADPPLAPAEDGVQGLRFDPSRNAFVSIRVTPELSFAFRLRLRQFLDWELDGFFVAREELARRLAELARDPDGGAGLAEPGALASLVDDLAAAADSRDPALAPILDARVELLFTAAGGGDVPARAEWHAPPRLWADLIDSAEDGPARARLAEAAAAARRDAEDDLAPRRRALAEVLDRHRGAPARHKRGHWAFVNLASVGQSVAEMRRDGGVLARGRTLLEPAILRSRYAAARALKVRFVLNDRLEINVLSDEDYWGVIARHGFPPNHETLSITRPILAAGYLTLDAGRIVGLEDDGLMIPGKLPPGLPPMQEVLEALGFDLDPEQLARHALVLDWEGFAACSGRPELPAVPADPEAAREALIAAGHGARPALAVAFARAAHARGADAAAELAAALRGFRLINTSARAMAAGELPRNAEWIDESLAGYLARKVLA